MSTSRAAPKPASVLPKLMGPPAAALLRSRLVAAILLALLGGRAFAQAAPTVGLDAYQYEVGQVLHLSGAALAPDAAYRVTVTPAGEPSRATEVRTDRSGVLRFSTPLEKPGDHTVSVRGPGLNASFTVTVTAPPGTAGGAESTPDGGATAPGEAEGASPPEAGAEAPPTAPEDAAPSQGAPAQGAPAGEAAEAAPGSEPEPATEAQPGATPGTAPTPGATAPGTPETGTPETPSQAPGTTPPALTQEPPAGTPPTVGSESQAAGGALGYPVVQLTDAGVVGVQNGSTVWTLGFEPGSGETAGVLQSGTEAYVGHGNSLLVVDARTGVIHRRYRLPAQVSAVTSSAGVPVVTMTYSNGAEGRMGILPSGPESLEPFDVDPKLYGWLRTEAAVADPVARLSQDPTNPWLYLEAARAAQPGSAAEADYIEGALENAATFYEGAQLARELMRFSPPQNQAAASAMYAAFGDFVARGYRAPLLFDQSLAESYGFPLGALKAALGRGDMQGAAFWADWVYLLATPAVPETQAALREYSTYLRADDQREAADRWLERSREGGGFDLASSVRQAALDVGRTGWYGVAALLVALLALYVALAAKYWRPQSVTLRRGGSKSPLARLFFLRYATFTERLVAVLLLAAAMALTGLQGWARDGDALPGAWGSGSLASVPALDAVARTDGHGPAVAFVRGFAEQMAGATDPAAEAYRAAPDDADAVNNLGVLQDDAALFRRALDLKPGLPAANFNLGQGPNPSRLLATFAPDAKALVVPDETRLRSAVAGSFQGALAGVFTDPWTALTGVAGVNVAHWLWLVIVVAFLLIALLNLVQLVLPRPRLARNAPRTPLYHLLALLLPGTGQADELWGVLLSVPWAIFGVDALLHYFALGAAPTIGLMTDLIALGVIYLVNLVTFFVELASYGRRMRALKLNDPETARAFGLRAGG